MRRAPRRGREALSTPERDETNRQSWPPRLRRVLTTRHLGVLEVVGLRLQHVAQPPVRVENRWPHAAHRSACLQCANVEKYSDVLLGRCRILAREPLVWRAIRTFVSSPQCGALRP